jgi:CheY-like chemotaxis protein
VQQTIRALLLKLFWIPLRLFAPLKWATTEGLFRRYAEHEKVIGMGTTKKSALKVLVIDDREAHAQGLAELLEISGFQSTYALTGQSGLKAAREEKVDAVLLDLNLPDMNGYEVCHALREQSETKNIAIVFHTAEPSMSKADEADAFLTYPIATEHICNVLRGCIAKRASMRAKEC